MPGTRRSGLGARVQSQHRPTSSPSGKAFAKALFGNELAQRAEDRFDDVLLLLTLARRKPDGGDEVLKPPHVGVPDPSRPWFSPRARRSSGEMGKEVTTLASR